MASATTEAPRRSTTSRTPTTDTWWPAPVSTSTWTSTLGRIAGHLPAGIAAAQTAVPVVEAHGTKAKVVAGASGVAGYAAGEAATGAAASVLEGVSIGAAPETMGLSLVGGAVAFGTGYAVEHYGPAAYDWASHAAGDVANVVTHPGDTLSSIGDALGL